MTPKAPPKKKNWSWRSQAFRGLIYQVIAIGLVVMAVWWLAANTLHNMQVRGIQSGFDFLKSPAGFDIGESLYTFDSAKPYWQAFLVGLTNTLRVAIIGIILTTILGTLLGVGRFSRNAMRWCVAFATRMSSFSAMCQCFCNCSCGTCCSLKCCRPRKKRGLWGRCF
jgi:general L-amino acid transport system permease protein